jgi:membrane protein implicated in regulation of membrane protease activity
MLRGLHGMVAHHGFLWSVLVVSGVALLGVGTLVVLGILSPLNAALIFSGVSGTGALLAADVVRSLHHQPLPAYERLLGSRATVVQPLTPQGRVLVQGENWAATLDDSFTDQAIPTGQMVRVLAVEDLRLIVVPASDSPTVAPLPSAAHS